MLNLKMKLYFSLLENLFAKQNFKECVFLRKMTNSYQVCFIINRSQINPIFSWAEDPIDKPFIHNKPSSGKVRIGLSTRTENMVLNKGRKKIHTRCIYTN